MAEDCIRVLVVDDTVTYRNIVKFVLAGVPGIEVVGAAANGKIALDKIEQLRPDMMTLDLEMPVMDGLEVLQHLKQSGDDVGTIVLSGTTERGASVTLKALELGAFDFVAKPTCGTSEENVHALKADLQPKIEAFARSLHVRKLLSGQVRRNSGTVATAAPVEKNIMPPRVDVVGPARAELVAVGISTGGPQALNQMLPQLPAKLGAAVLIVQHMPPFFTASLASDLDKRCSLKVSEAIDGQEVKPGHVLIAPGGKQMKVVRAGPCTIIRITDDPPENSCCPSVDYLFRSVTRVYGQNAIGVIMTGMGNDGTLGCRQMKQRGAAIIAQDEASCVVFGMPREPIEEGIVDVVAPLEEIAAEIVRRVPHQVVV